MIRWIAKPFLWLFTCAIPVFISACYGSPYQGSYPWDSGSGLDLSTVKGHVIDQNTGEGIVDIEVSCMLPDGSVAEDTYTALGDGSFKLRYDASAPCEVLKFQDLDEEENGGPYQTKLLDFEENMDDLVIEMTPED
ncbi:MAG: hypothetical protein GY854_28910 [Deltaproteobacteria bacterium]|nr:hypothetical protein [Deltaproteobacteria bacterium]